MKSFKEWYKINELINLQPIIIEKIKNFNPALLLDFDYNRPFIYVFNNKTIHLGGTDAYHDSILEKDYDDTRTIRDVYYSRNEAIGVVGRIGRGYKGYDENGDNYEVPADVTIIAFYIKDNYTHQAGQEAVLELLKQDIIKNNDLVITGSVPSTVVEVYDFVKNNRIITDDERRKGNLQIAYHIGAWPNGKRLTMAEKQAIAKELGLVGSIKKNPWQKGMEDNKILNPGEKWWAPHSESSFQAIC